MNLIVSIQDVVMTSSSALVQFHNMFFSLFTCFQILKTDSKESWVLTPFNVCRHHKTKNEKECRPNVGVNWVYKRV